MTSLTPQPTQTLKRKIHSLKIDMTPMVDLGFLLITFFIFTAALSQPTVMRLIMPKEGENTPVAESKTLTFLFDKQKMYAYEGRWEEALAENKIRETDFHLQKGMGSLIRNKQAVLTERDDLVVMLKPLSTASYQQVLAALDEMQINVVTRYAVVDASDSEISFMQKQ